jgi:hypothetical protein
MGCVCVFILLSPAPTNKLSNSNLAATLWHIASQSPSNASHQASKASEPAKQRGRQQTTANTKKNKKTKTRKQEKCSNPTDLFTDQVSKFGVFTYRVCVAPRPAEI